MSSYLLTAVGVYFDQPTTEHASFHGHRTVSATEPFQLSDLKSRTICHRNYDTWTSALDNSETCWNCISLGFSQPRHIVTFLLLRLRSFLTYLLTNWLTDWLTYYSLHMWCCNKANWLSLGAGPLNWVFSGSSAMLPTIWGGLVNWEWYAYRHRQST